MMNYFPDLQSKKKEDMKEQLVTFETAKLAKEKGFEGSCNHWTCIGYSSLEENREIKKYEAITDDGQIIGTHNVRRISKSQPHIALVPTQSLLQKWLRETHKIHPYVVPWGDGDSWHLCTIRKDQKDLIYSWHWKDEGDKIKFKTYEEALEYGLCKCMELLTSQGEG